MRQFILAGAMALVCASAQAQFSAELGYTGTTMKAMDDGDSLKTSPAAIRGIVSYEVHPNLSLEGMLAFGLGDSAIKLNGASVAGLKMKLDHAMGLYIKPKMKLNDSVGIFARLGFAESRFKASSAFASASEKDGSVSYGAGLSYSIAPSYAINADYMRYFSKDGTKVHGWTVGVGFKF